MRLYEKAFADDLKLAEELAPAHRWNAAASAASSARGDGIDAPTDAAERAVLRAKALRWLREDLALRIKQLESDKPTECANAQQAVRYWQEAPDFAGIRDEAALAKLPADEQAAFTKLWTDVATMLKKAQTPTTKESKK